ncbi:MAG TPA: DinB family protein [Planctomycetes bacterium]|nr:DinB family protein [Fuerstiella sp.]HIK95823.1 DinB family protein [Planctomycetota bacterium]
MSAWQHQSASFMFRTHFNCQRHKMTTIDFIRRGITTSHMLTMGLIDDMEDAAFQQPTSSGGNHPMWVLGHLAYSESNIVEHMIKGHENPLIDWKSIFGSSSEPTTNADDYPAWADVRAKADEVQKNTLAFVDSLTDADLDNPSKNCPPGREDFMGTVGACLLVLTLHPVMHRGQVADARRMVNRAPILG